jgi:formate dehydrogenase subunit gamma
MLGLCAAQCNSLLAFCSAKLTWYTSSDSFRAFFWQNLPEFTDFVWLARITMYCGRTTKTTSPRSAKYNAGQKFVFWSQFILIGTLFVTGVGLCEQGLGYFENLLGFKATIEQKRWAVLTHVSAAVLAITVWIIHVYAVIWVRGTISAMTRGTVTGGWGWRHHRKWLRKEVARGEVEKVA